jgi:hypothetical protein
MSKNRNSTRSRTLTREAKVDFKKEIAAEGIQVMPISDATEGGGGETSKPTATTEGGGGETSKPTATTENSDDK